MDFIIDYKFDKKEHNELTKEEKNTNQKQFELNTYASFCMSFVDQLKDKLEFEKIDLKNEKKENILRYKIIMPVIIKPVKRIYKKPINPVKDRISPTCNKFIGKNKKNTSNEPKGVKNKCRNSASLLK